MLNPTWSGTPTLVSQDPSSGASSSVILNEKHKVTYSSEFVWRVDNYSERITQPVIANSPTFVLGPASWRLDMVHEACKRSRISIIVNRMNGTEAADLKFTLHLKEIPQYFDDDDQHVLGSVVFNQNDTSQVMDHLFSLEQIEQAAQEEDTLDLYCSVTVMCKSTPSHEPSLLSLDLQNLCDPSTTSFCDVILVVNGEEYPAHKSILAARSAVMKAMFESRMIESSQNRILIRDVDSDVFREMMSYIYTGKNNYSIIANKPQEALAIADRYNLPGMKAFCEDVLAHSITPNNAVSILKVADIYNAQILKHKLYQFLMSNFLEVFCTSDFLELCKTDPVLLQQLHKSLSSLQKLQPPTAADIRKNRFSPYCRGVEMSDTPKPSARQCP